MGNIKVPHTLRENNGISSDRCWDSERFVRFVEWIWYCTDIILNKFSGPLCNVKLGEDNKWHSFIVTLYSLFSMFQLKLRPFKIILTRSQAYHNLYTGAELWLQFTWSNNTAIEPKQSMHQPIKCTISSYTSNILIRINIRDRLKRISNHLS